MKDDNILLEALKEIARKNPYGWTLHNGEMCNRIAIDAITKYNQSPSDESNQSYWKQRCELAEYLLAPDASTVLPKEFDKWQKIKSQIIPDESNQDELEYDYFNAIGSKARGEDFTFYPHVIAELKSQYKITKR